MKRIANTSQGRFCVDPEDQFVSAELLRQHAFGLDEIERARRFLSPASRALVVGAHVGAVAIPLAKTCRELVAIEPNPDTYASLEVNIRLNASSNMTAYNVAANDRNEMLPFVMNTHNSGGSKRLPRIRDHKYFYDSPRIVEVQGMRLDDLLPGVQFELVFMDAEGSEYFAFLGMQQILTTARVLIVEFLPHHLTGVAGITVGEFVRPLEPHFDLLTIPGTNIRGERRDFRLILESMFTRGQGHPGVVFQKLSNF